MNLEILFIGVVGFLIYDGYHNQYYTKLLLSYKKQYKYIGYIFFAFCVYLLFKRDPTRARELLLQSTNFMKPFPIDLTSATDMQQPANLLHTLGMHHLAINPEVSTGGQVQKKKRSVSETKKKYVASQQDWKCGECRKTLNAWFEVDHKRRLEYGGSNEVDNLVALCRECHGKKTAFENM